MKLKFYEKRTCTTCRQAKAFLIDHGADLDTVDLNKGLTVDQLEKIIGKHDYRKFLNTRNQLYREMKMKDNPPPYAKALRLMSENPNLIRRPIVRKGSKIALGFDQEALSDLL